MKLSSNAECGARSAEHRRSERGSATILVFALVAILVVYMNGNQLALHSAKRELRLIEAKQLKKFQAPPKPAQPVQP